MQMQHVLQLSLCWLSRIVGFLACLLVGWLVGWLVCCSELFETTFLISFDFVFDFSSLSTAISQCLGCICMCMCAYVGVCVNKWGGGAFGSESDITASLAGVSLFCYICVVFVVLQFCRQLCVVYSSCFVLRAISPLLSFFVVVFVLCALFLMPLCLIITVSVMHNPATCCIDSGC